MWARGRSREADRRGGDEGLCRSLQGTVPTSRLGPYSRQRRWRAGARDLDTVERRGAGDVRDAGLCCGHAAGVPSGVGVRALGGVGPRSLMHRSVRNARRSLWAGCLSVCLSTDGYLLRTFLKWAATAAQGPRGALQRVGPRGPGRPAELGEPATRRPGSVRGPRRSPDSVPPAGRGPRAGRGGASVPWGLCGPRHPLPAAAHRSLREGK